MSDQTPIRNLENVKYVVERSQNPNPWVLTIIIIIIYMFIKYSYKMYSTSNISGIWVSSIEKKYDYNLNAYNLYTYDISYNMLNNTICVNFIDDKKIKNGVVDGKLIYIYDQGKLDKNSDNINVGVLVNNKIKWTDGTTWERQIRL
jgi:hypothetical protein